MYRPQHRVIMAQKQHGMKKWGNKKRIQKKLMVSSAGQRWKMAGYDSGRNYWKWLDQKGVLSAVLVPDSASRTGCDLQCQRGVLICLVNLVKEMSTWVKLKISLEDIEGTYKACRRCTQDLVALYHQMWAMAAWQLRRREMSRCGAFRASCFAVGALNSSRPATIQDRLM